MSTIMSIPTADDSVNQAGPSKAPSPPICNQCNSEPSKYTCPRCQTRTCSLNCSQGHKAATGCSGERDRTTFVPMNQYGYSTLVNDYVFLEEVGRKVENWGHEIVRNGIQTTRPSQHSASLRASSARGGRGRGRGTTRAFQHRKDRRSYLAMQLGIRNVDVDILPPGMKRATQNMSVWDGKGKRALLTIELVFHPPPDPLTRQASKSASIISNKTDWDQTIRRIIQTCINSSERTRSHDALLRWLSPDDEDETIPSSVLCLMRRPRTEDDLPVMNPTRPSYYKLDWNQKLSRALRHKHFVEFPTILMTDETLFDGVLVDDNGVAEDLHERRPKRRELDIAEARKTISCLVGGYGSEDENDNEPNALETLADYSESEDIPEPDGDGIPDETGEEQADSSQDALDIEQVMDDLVVEDDAGGDEDVDWGDDEIAEDEAKLATLSAAIQQRYSLQ